MSERHSQIFDDVFRTMEEHTPSIMIPLINEVFGTSYAKDEPVTRLGDKHHLLTGMLETDACLKIGRKIYHCECESNPSNSVIVVRMFQYDIAVAMDTKQKEDGNYVIAFPHSCVLYLRHNSNTKEEERMTVRMPDGQEVYYKVPIIKCQEYTKEEIFEKKLYVMLPFYILRYEKYLDAWEKEEEKRRLLIEEYEEICHRLEETLAKEDREAYAEVHKRILQVSDYVLEKHVESKKGVEMAVGGRVMESYKDQLLREGREEGREETLLHLVKEGLLDISVAAEHAGKSVEEFRKLLEGKTV